MRLAGMVTTIHLPVKLLAAVPCAVWRQFQFPAMTPVTEVILFPNKPFRCAPSCRFCDALALVAPLDCYRTVQMGYQEGYLLLVLLGVGTCRFAKIEEH